MRQGQEVTITCESEGISETKLQWKKQTEEGDVSVPSNLVTVFKDRSTNQVRAVLKVTDIQLEDAGVYKCVLTAFEKTDHKMTAIHVKGILSKTWSYAKYALFSTDSCISHRKIVNTENSVVIKQSKPF